MWCHRMTVVILTVQKDSHGVHALQLIELFVSMLRYRNRGDYVIVTGGLRHRNRGDYVIVTGGLRYRNRGDYVIVDS